MDKLLEGLERTERMANIIAQQPKHIRNDIAGLVEEEQRPGSFGDLTFISSDISNAGHLDRLEHLIVIDWMLLSMRIINGE